MGNSKKDKELRLRFKITQSLEIQLTRLKVFTYSKHGGKPHKCHICKYSGKFKSTLERHLQSHTGEKPFSCNLCNYKCFRRCDLNRHIVTHTGEKPYTCAFCAQSFAQNGNKTRHETICKLNPGQNDPTWVEMQKRFKCKLCPYSTALVSHLKIHLMTHTGEKPLACNLCNLKFSTQSNLRSHIFKHTREKPLNCQFCTRGFAKVADQKKHERICKLNPMQGDAKWVEEQKKFKCHLCTYRTIRKRDLERHSKSHTREKPYNCPLCLYKSNAKSNVHRHLSLVHVIEKDLHVSGQ